MDAMPAFGCTHFEPPDSVWSAEGWSRSRWAGPGFPDSLFLSLRGEKLIKVAPNTRVAPRIPIMDLLETRVLQLVCSFIAHPGWRTKWISLFCSAVICTVRDNTPIVGFFLEIGKFTQFGVTRTHADPLSKSIDVTRCTGERWMTPMCTYVMISLENLIDIYCQVEIIVPRHPLGSTMHQFEMKITQLFAVLCTWPCLFWSWGSLQCTFVHGFLCMQQIKTHTKWSEQLQLQFVGLLNSYDSQL